jgi:hypothetical protein
MPILPGKRSRWIQEEDSTLLRSMHQEKVFLREEETHQEKV